MSDLYLVFNNTLVDLLCALKNSFATNEDVVSAERHAKHKFTLFSKTKELFELYSPHVSNKILTAINERDCESLYKGNEENKFIKDIGGRKVFDDLKANEEQGILWNSLQSLSKHFAIILATGDSLNVFENIAKTFVEKNKDMDPAQYQSALFSQLFTDKDLSRQLLGAFENPESISKIIGNLSPILSSLAPAQTDAEPDEGDDGDKEDEEDEEDIKSDTDEDVENKSDDEEDKDRKPSRIFAKIKKRRRGRNKKKKKKNSKNPFVDLANMMSGVELKEDELKELHNGVRSTLSGETPNIAGAGGFDISTMMASLATGDTSALTDIFKNAQEKDGSDNSECNEILSNLSPMLETMSSVMSGMGSDSKMPTNDVMDAIKKMTGFKNTEIPNESNTLPNLPDDEVEEGGTENVKLPDIPDDLPDLISDDEILEGDTERVKLPDVPDDLPDLNDLQGTKQETSKLPPLPDSDDESEEENNTSSLSSSVVLQEV